MNNYLKILLSLLMLCTLVVIFYSCSFRVPLAIRGIIPHYDQLIHRNLSLTYEDERSRKPDSLSFQNDGSFYFYSTLHNILPQTLTLWSNDTAIARLVFKNQDSTYLYDPVSKMTHRFEYRRTDTTEITDLIFEPHFDSTSISILNVDKLLSQIDYSDSLLVIHFKSIPPQGSHLYFWGGYRLHNFKDTTIDVASTIISVNLHYFDDGDKNIFSGFDFINPYGWHKSYQRWDLAKKNYE
jgi:hypothetical protein